MSTKSLSHNEAAETATQCDAAPDKRELWLSINSNIIMVFKVKLNGCFNVHLTQRGTFLSPIVAFVPLSSVSGGDTEAVMLHYAEREHLQVL